MNLKQHLKENPILATDNKDLLLSSFKWECQRYQHMLDEPIEIFNTEELDKMRVENFTRLISEKVQVVHNIKEFQKEIERSVSGSIKHFQESLTNVVDKMK